MDTSTSQLMTDAELLMTDAGFLMTAQKAALTALVNSMTAQQQQQQSVVDVLQSATALQLQMSVFSSSYARLAAESVGGGEQLMGTSGGLGEKPPLPPHPP